MRVKIYDVSQSSGAETFRDEADLSEMFEAGDPELEFATLALNQYGRATVGGGAAPLVRLVKIDDSPNG